MKNILLAILAFGLSGCASGSKSNGSLPYSEFKKILSPRAVVPIKTGEESLVLIKMPEDKYSKIYKLDHKTKAYSLQKDFGRNISSVTVDPWNNNFYLYIDNDGDENYGIYSYNIDSTEITPLFVNKGFKAFITGFSNNKDHLFFMSNHTDKKTYSLYKMKTSNKKVTRLTKGKRSWDYAVIQPNEKHIALVQYKGNNESHLYLMQTKSKKIYRLMKTEKTVYSPSFFDLEKDILYVDSDENKDRKGCASINLLKRPLKLNWVLSDDSKDLTCSYNKVAGVTKVFESYAGKIVIRLKKGIFGEDIALPVPDNVIASNFTVLPGTDKAFVKLMKSDSPGDFYTFHLNKGKNGKLKAITKNNVSKISNKDFSNSYDFNFKSFDGKDIHGIIYAKKSWIKSSKKRPVILWPHGGPDSHSRHVYHSLFQYWTMNGYVVFAPNFRGSTGFGKKFETLNDKDWGGGHIKDVIWGKRALSKLNYVNSDRMFIVGASFGGFSTLSAITQYPKEFKGAVAMLAISNLFTFLKSIPPDPAWQGEFLTEMGHPVKDKALYKERSPYFHADQVAIPLKIYQAENDTRTVKAEMDQFVDKLTDLKIPVEYVVLEKEGHGFSRDESAKKAFEGTIEFLNRLK